MTDQSSTTSRRWPIRQVAISASHELYPSPAAALEATVQDRLARRLEIRYQHVRRRTWCPYAVESTRLNRSIEAGVDDIKFLYPVLDNLPVLVFSLLNFARAGVRICLYGSPEICRVAEVVRDYLVEIAWLRDRQDMLLVEEDRNAISFFESFKRSTEPLALADDDAVVWSAADLVLAYDVWPWLLESDIEHHELIVNMIAREAIFPPGAPEFLRLEYFDSLHLEGHARAREVRQPDMLVFTGRARGGLAALAEIRGKPEAALLGIFMKFIWRGLFGRRAPALLHAIRYGIKRRSYSLAAGEGIAERHANELATAFFGVPTRVKGCAADPFIVKDADGFEEVFGYYRTLLQSTVDAAPTREAGYGHLARLYPHAEQLFALSERLRPLQSEIALWKCWPEFIRDKTSTYNARLRSAFRSAGVESEQDPVADYFDSDGSFVFHGAPPHSSIAGSVKYLAETYAPRYEQGRRRYALLTRPSRDGQRIESISESSFPECVQALRIAR